jgi:hypothetical protein
MSTKPTTPRHPASITSAQRRYTRQESKLGALVIMSMRSSGFGEVPIFFEMEVLPRPLHRGTKTPLGCIASPHLPFLPHISKETSTPRRRLRLWPPTSIATAAQSGAHRRIEHWRTNWRSMHRPSAAMSMQVRSEALWLVRRPPCSGHRRSGGQSYRRRGG